MPALPRWEPELEILIGKLTTSGQAALLSMDLQRSGLAFFLSPLGLHRAILASDHLTGVRHLSFGC